MAQDASVPPIGIPLVASIGAGSGLLFVFVLIAVHWMCKRRIGRHTSVRIAPPPRSDEHAKTDTKLAPVQPSEQEASRLTDDEEGASAPPLVVVTAGTRPSALVSYGSARLEATMPALCESRPSTSGSTETSTTSLSLPPSRPMSSPRVASAHDDSDALACENVEDGDTVVPNAQVSVLSEIMDMGDDSDEFDDILEDIGWNSPPRRTAAGPAGLHQF